MSDSASVLVTGGSGLLGRALMKTIQDSGKWSSVTGTAFSRKGANLVNLDLTDLDGMKKYIEETKPTFVVHAAAQRFPDKVDKDLEAATKLNVEATQVLAKAINSYGGNMIYISTDYVFDGKTAPYKVTDQTNPVNIYGKLKLDGELATLGVDPENLVLRIPVLYGPVEYLEESAVTVLFKLLLSPSDKDVVSDYEIRRPSHVDDIAHVVQKLLEAKHKRGIEIQGIYQWCGLEALTKFGMVQIMANALKKDATHIKGNAEKPAETGTQRPYDTTMDTSRLQELGIEHHTPFEQGVAAVLGKWNK